MCKYHFLIFLFFAQIGFSQNGFFTMPDIDANLATIKDMVIDNDTIVVYGTIGMGNPNKWGQYFAKFDTLGNLLSTSPMIADSVELSSSDIGNITKTADGGYAMLGAYSHYNQDSSESVVYTYLLKVKHDLSLDFIKFYENIGYKKSLNQQLLVHQNGYILLCVEQKAGEHGGSWFVRYVDLAGAVIWKKSYYKPNTYNSIYDVAILDSNEIVIFGNSRDNNPIGTPYTQGFIYPIMMAIDSLGNVKWKWNWDGGVTGILDVGFTFIPTEDGGFMLGGMRDEFPTPSTIVFHALLTKLDPNLNLEWRIQLDTFDFHNGRILSIIEAPDSSYIVSGGVNTYATRSIYHGKFGVDGIQKWGRIDSTIVGEEYWYQGYVKRSDLLSSGSIVSAGYMRNPDKNFSDWSFVMKLSPDGCMDTLACWPVALGDDVQGLDYQLDVYPNPASDVLLFRVFIH